MKKLNVFILLLFIYLIFDFQLISAAEQRYNIFDTSSGVILLDKEEGTTWEYSQKGWIPLIYPIKETNEKTSFCFSPKGEIITIEGK